MDPKRFDTIAKAFAARRTRRAALATGGTGILGVALAAFSHPAARTDAQAAATPAAGAATPAPASATNQPASYLFVQSFQSGSLVPQVNSEDTFSLTLTSGLGHTVYFSDRPNRFFGAAPTGKFLEKFPFAGDNPPNAALIMDVTPDNEDVVVLELTEPAYDESSRSATYQAKILSDYTRLNAMFQETPQTAQSVHTNFGAASLLIDTCPFLSNCYVGCHDCFPPVGTIPYEPYATCWNNQTYTCDLCDGRISGGYDTLDKMCNDAYPSQCNGQCYVLRN